ncbi:hypothetical protein chiPu_0028287, partial [Chiloscyllium punctatum]|nr:hypothetical protein [Chiloscyllium punctatum]
MISVIAVNAVIEAGRPSRCRIPAMPHMLSWPIYSMISYARSDLGLGAPLIDLIDMALAPLDQPPQPVIEVDRGGEADFFLCPLRRSDAIAHKRGLAPRRIVDRLVGAGEIEELLGDLLQRGPL